jgi:hypothetical protein
VGFGKPARSATCREPRPGASSSHLFDRDCHRPAVAFCLANPIRSQLGKAVRRADRGFCRHALHLTTAIVQSGPYGFSRNPIYLAFSLFQAGIALAVNDAWTLVTLLPAIAVMSFVVIPREERYLEARFGEDYARYKARVQRWL